MRTANFNATFNRMKEANGKEYFENDVQYCAYWLMDLTDIQHNKVVDLMLSWNYEIKTNCNGVSFVYTPNGLGLRINK